jgi:hypothetical protein
MGAVKIEKTLGISIVDQSTSKRCHRSHLHIGHPAKYQGFITAFKFNKGSRVYSAWVTANL